MLDKILVDCSFDAGSIEVINVDDFNNLKFKIRSDTNSNFAQWFYFRLSNVKNKLLNISFVDMDRTAYPDGWKDYRICYSNDNCDWLRLDSKFDGKNLNFEIMSGYDVLYFAYFEPYSYDRHMQLINNCNLLPNIFSYESLGKTKQNRNIDFLTASSFDLNNKGLPLNDILNIWIIARQHPGETMAEWFMEGVIDRLSDYADSTVSSLLRRCIFYLVPNMNPDGSVNGNLRVNANGVNLNREWLNPSLEHSPEVYHVRQKMLDIGCDLFFDIHGDEAIPYVFTAGCDDNPSFSDYQKDAQDKFTNCLKLINPDYQTKYGYTKGQFSSQTATLATNWVGDNFGCLALTLEMPFKDNENIPNMDVGWDGRRSYILGRDFLTAISVYIANAKFIG